MTSEPPAPPSFEGPLSPPYVRLLQIAVLVMGLMILVGLGAVVLRIVQLASAPKGQPAALSRSGAVAPVPNARLSIPAGAAVRQVSLSGDRLAVHYEGPRGPAIAIMDASTGTVLTRIDIVPDVPR